MAIRCRYLAEEEEPTLRSACRRDLSAGRIAGRRRRRPHHRRPPRARSARLRAGSPRTDRRSGRSGVRSSSGRKAAAQPETHTFIDGAWSGALRADGRVAPRAIDQSDRLQAGSVRRDPPLRQNQRARCVPVGTRDPGSSWRCPAMAGGRLKGTPGEDRRPPHGRGPRSDREGPWSSRLSRRARSGLPRSRTARG